MAGAVDLTRIADEHARLLQTVATYDNAPAELRDTTDLLEALEKDLYVRESRMSKLINKRKSEHKDLDKLQRSSSRRFLFRVTHGGKEGLERKLEKEEREYIEAAQAEHNESQAIAELREAEKNARTKKADLEFQVKKRKEMLKQIKDLHASAFEGPSPDFPEEDAAEDEVGAAELHFEHMQTRLSHEDTVFGILNQAAACANGAQSALQSANMSATYDTFGIGGLWAEMAESDSLIKAQTLAAQAQRHLERARGAQPLVNHIQCGKIVEPDWLNIVFDNMYTDFMFQQKIQQSIAAVQRFQEGIFAECAASEERKKSHERDATDARSFLKSRRRALVAVRREILKRVKEDGGVSLHARGDAPQAPAPPLYMPQPEMGTRVLARSQSPLPAGGVTAPVPTMGRQSAPPRYEPSESPVLPAPVGMCAHNLPGENLSREAAEPVLSRTLSSMRSGTPLRYAPPPGPPPAHSHNLTSSRAISKDRRAYTPPSGLPPAPPITSSISNPESKLQRTYTPSPGHSPSLSIYASSPPPLFAESLSTFSRSSSIHMPVAMPEPSFTPRPHSPLPPDMSANVRHTPPASGAEPGKEIGLDQKLSSDASDTDARAAASTSRAPAADAAAGPSPAERSRSGSRSCSPNLASVLDTSDRGQPQLKVFASNNPYRLAS